jgi:phage/plasmid-associated DNA primase
MIIIIDEYTHNKKLQSEILQLTEGRSIKVNIKYEKPKYVGNKIKIVLISNKDIKEYDEDIKEAFENRLIKLTFEKKLKPEEIDLEINNKLKDEEAAIIVYSNKKYFEKILKKKTRMDYSKTLEYIHYDQKLLK